MIQDTVVDRLLRYGTYIKP